MFNYTFNIAYKDKKKLFLIVTGKSLVDPDGMKADSTEIVDDSKNVNVLPIVDVNVPLVVDVNILPVHD